MSGINQAIRQINRMDDLTAIDSPVHRLHPLSKLVTTTIYIMVVVSFHKYDLSGLAAMILHPAVLFALGSIPPGICFYRMRYVMPLVCAVGLLNPFFDRTPMLVLGPLTLTGGIISMVTLMLKGILCLTASFLLAATTPVDSLCYALLQIHMPRMIVTLFLLTFRYVFVMLEEAAVMTEAYQLRAPGQKGIHYTAWGSFLGQLLLRSMDRAGELYESMLLRGFDGSFRYASGKKPGIRDILFPVLMITMFLVFRFNRVADLLGALVLRGV